MAKAEKPEPGSLARAKRLREQIDQLKKRRAGAASGGSSPPGNEGEPPRSLRDIIHDRMEKLDKDKKS